jgi:choloylglycine hydrolase
MSNGIRLSILPLVFASVGLPLVAARPAHACTTFLMDQDGPVVGKSYDWSEGAGLVIVNKRGLAKTGLLLDPEELPLHWTSTYASITFNQYGRELPNGGMNEAGLVVEIMWLSSRYPAPDERPAVNELQWIQWALDAHANVAELVAAAPEIRVVSEYADVHYLACDASSACAAFEYLNGALVITDEGDLIVDTLTNNTYADSAAFLAQHVGFGGSDPIPTSTSSLDRFVRASSLALGPQALPVPDSAFAILDSVSQGSFSQWNIVYRPATGTVHFRTHDTETIKSVELDAFDLDCTAPAKVLDIDTAQAGAAATLFADYTRAANEALLEITMAEIEPYLPDGAVDEMVRYPESCACTLAGPTPQSRAGDEEGGCAAVLSPLPIGILVILRRRAGVWRRRA